MMKPVATWFIAVTLALVAASDDLFIGEYQLLAAPLRVRARVWNSSLQLFFERLVNPKFWVSGEPMRLTGGPDTYTVNHADFEGFRRFINGHTGTPSMPKVNIQNGDLTNLTDYHPLLFNTILQGKEVTFFRRALPLIPGTYVHTEGLSFALILRITGSLEMTFKCRNGRRDRQFQHTFRDLIVGEVTNVQFGKGEDYKKFIDEVAVGCARTDLPTGSPTFYLFSATDSGVYLALDGAPPKTFALVKIL
ncbi:hypothetical protein FOZ63_027331 [Perkinsus olseni]|uniref:Uncharacterized protein n=2 Tax=Perkinsus olseni TaxID=32597 RepID=A0A7J6QDA5_PEROL|nr:hypothetical protein FOZ63_027331 [Perkinsus olseni]